jgi:GTP cyclohydrolase I
LVVAIEGLLRAAGRNLQHKDLAHTPERVARLWGEHFLAGYRADPAKILGETVDGEGETELVIVRDLPYHGLCPHHLLPYTGRATVAYLPAAGRLVGFGRLEELLRCFTRRLTLQERAGNDVADALMRHLGARGSACVMVGVHTCLSVPDDKHEARVVTAAFRGDLRDRPDLRDRLLP